MSKDFKKHNYYEAHYEMDSVASWNGNQKKCFGYCFRDDNLTPHCMCNPSLMEDPNYTTLAGMVLPNIIINIPFIWFIGYEIMYFIAINVISGIFAAIFSVIGLVLNILAILSLKEVAETDYPTLYVISLSFSDLVSCVFTLPLQSGRFLFR